MTFGFLAQASAILFEISILIYSKSSLFLTSYLGPTRLITYCNTTKIHIMFVNSYHIRIFNNSVNHFGIVEVHVLN